MLSVSELYIYPVKSLGGTAVNEAKLTERGFEHDRRWMLTDDNGVFLSQRELHTMALLKVALAGDNIIVQHMHKPAETFLLPLRAGEGNTVMVRVWDDVCKAVWPGTEADEWFSEMLSYKCRLVYMPEETNRFVDAQYANNLEITSFSDGYPLLMIGQASLDDLNSRLTVPLPINRFRPNIVFTGGKPFLEDEMKIFEINGIQFYGVKPCARCVITTIDQLSGIKGKEPLKTLSTFRMHNNNVYFGQNLLFNGEGYLRVGDSISLL